MKEFELDRECLKWHFLSKICENARWLVSWNPGIDRFPLRNSHLFQAAMVFGWRRLRRRGRRNLCRLCQIPSRKKSHKTLDNCSRLLITFFIIKRTWNADIWPLHRTNATTLRFFNDAIENYN